MNKNERPSFLKGKGAAVSIVLCFAAVIVLVGAYTFSNYRKDMEEQMARAEEQAEDFTEEIEGPEEEMATESAEETTTDQIVLPEEENGLTGGAGTPEDTMGTDEMGTDETGTEDPAEGQEASAESASAAPDVWFSEESTLEWPASGPVIMSYSMDKTVYFQTLDQYQYNPAMIVSGEVGETIGASASGIVTNIEETAETGTTVTMDMGNGYSAVYGQLTEVPLSIGDYVNTGETVGILAEPSRYYSVEGPNLYFEVMKDGEPVDPMNFME